MENQPFKLLQFSEITPEHERDVGGKAYQLAVMSQASFPVPPGWVLNRAPQNQVEWNQIIAPWEASGLPLLAVRSSAVGEDGAELSFAGQQKSFLNVKSIAGLEVAITACFESIQREASQAYREFFSPNERASGLTPKMNVVLQQMVQPKFSGVFFSKDPRNGKGGWVLETIRGLGEDLVSGHRTPLTLRENCAPSGDTSLSEWNDTQAKQVIEAGQAVKELLHFEVDMEWAIDFQNRFWVLQARPITTSHDADRFKDALKCELDRIKRSHSPRSVWDGQTFAEWAGIPSPLAMSIWKEVFKPKGALGMALTELGYIGAQVKPYSLHRSSILEPIFGRAYINLSRMEMMLFGKTAYSTTAKPTPHLEFKWDRINPSTIFHAPAAAMRMLKVAWRMQTDRNSKIKNCQKALQDLKPSFTADHLLALTLSELYDHFEAETRRFAGDLQKWPMVLILMIESTLQTLKTTLTHAFGKKLGEDYLQKWMRSIHTVTAEMDVLYNEACRNSALQEQFLNTYGHRCAGELELEKPRWNELGTKAFRKASIHVSSHDAGIQTHDVNQELKDQLSKVNSVHQSIIQQECAYLGQMLELREQWKNEVMRSYAFIRELSLELGKRTALGDQVFWLRKIELRRICNKLSSKFNSELLKLIDKRQKTALAFRSISLPVVLTLPEIERIFDPKRVQNADESDMSGQGLSPGIAYGEVRVVSDPDTVDLDQWPENVILVAESTDPGWTPLFMHAKGIIVEKGGVLSHCAIVAREMGLPAVSGIQGCYRQLKEGDYVWVDGSTGRIARA